MKTKKDSGCRADEERKQGKKKVLLKLIHNRKLSTPIDKNIHVYVT